MLGIASVVVPVIRLQVALRARTEWRGRPVAVVAADRPQAPILEVSEEARASRILPGMRYASALGIEPALRAVVVEDGEVEQALSALMVGLRRFTPGIEPRAGEPGALWLDLRGLERVHGIDGGSSRRDEGAAAALERLARGLAGVLDEHDLAGAVVLGAHRFATYALARLRAEEAWRRRPRPRGGRASGRSARATFEVLSAEEEERRLARVPLERLGVDPHLRDGLARLAVRTVGDLLALPAGGLLERFGPDAYRLRAELDGASGGGGGGSSGGSGGSGRAAGSLDGGGIAAAAGHAALSRAPFASSPERLPRMRRLDFDDPEPCAERLLERGCALLGALLDELRGAGEAVAAVRIRLEREGGEARLERLAPAAPTLDARLLEELIRLRFDALSRAQSLAGGARALEVEVEAVPLPQRERALLREAPRRSLARADQALARLRAELGEAAVTRAVLEDGHLPEARFRFVALERLPERAAPPSPPLDPGAAPPLVRRILPRPVSLAHQREEEDGWLAAGLEGGAVTGLYGPFVLSGGWWRRELERSYHYAEVRRGDVLWLYRDRDRRRWFRQGTVE